MAFPKELYRKMNEQILWMLIEATQGKKSHVNSQSQLLIELLSKWSIPHILKFEKIYWSLLQRSFDADLWAAAYVVNDGCSQEEFLHFRNWLLLQGQFKFRKTVEDPEFLLEWLSLPMLHPIHYPDLENRIAELIAIKTRKPIELRYSEADFELSGYYWESDMEVIDKVPALCNKMGWGNQVPQGDWKTDDTPLYNSEATGREY